MGKWFGFDAEELKKSLHDENTYSALNNEKERAIYDKEQQLFAAMLTSDSQQQLEENFSNFMKFSVTEEFHLMFPECKEEELEELGIDKLASSAKLDFAYDSQKNCAGIEPQYWNLGAQFDSKRDGWLEQVVQTFTPETKKTIQKLTQINRERLEEKKLEEQNKAAEKKEPNPEVKDEAKPEVKEEVKPEVKEEPKPEVKAEPKPEVKEEVKPEVKPEIKPEVKEEVKPQAKEVPKPQVKSEDQIIINDTESSAIKLGLLLAQKIGAKGETDFLKAVGNGVISYGDMEDAQQYFDTKKGFREVCKAIAEKVNAHKPVLLNLPQKDGNTASYLLGTEPTARGDVLNIRPMEEVRKEMTAKDAADRSKYKEVSRENLQLMQKAVTSVFGKLDATGTAIGDTKEFKDMKATLYGFSDNGKGIPSDPRDFLSCMNKLEEKTFDYFYSQLDKSPNKRDEARFNQAAALLETISAIKEGRKPSKASMEKNIIACKAVKANYILKSKSKDPAKAEKASNILFNKSMFMKKVQTLQGKDKFKSMFDGKSPAELHDISTKIAKEVNKALHTEKVQTKEAAQKNQSKMAM